MSTHSNDIPEDEIPVPENEEAVTAEEALEDELELDADYQDAASEYENVETLHGEHSETAELKAQLDEMKDKMMRALAEAENTRRRAERTAEDARKYAVSAFAKDMLDVADNLRRALDAVSEEMRESNPELVSVLQGVEVTEKGLLKAFEKHGLQKIEPTEGKFDPNHHEVMFEADNTGKPAGEIVQLLEPGYVLNGRLIRPARVGVAKADPNASSHSIDTEV
jgi:molecular chaperone GrpE